MADLILAWKCDEIKPYLIFEIFLLSIFYRSQRKSYHFRDNGFQCVSKSRTLVFRLIPTTYRHLNLFVRYEFKGISRQRKQILNSVLKLKPPNLILVHGEMNEMQRLRAAILRQYEDDNNFKIEVDLIDYCPT